MEMMGRYLLELDHDDRGKLGKAFKRLKRREDTSEIDHLIDDLAGLQPIPGLIIEADAGVDVSKLRVITGLQLPFDVVVVQRDGNGYMREELEQRRDPDMIALVIRAMRASNVLRPLTDLVGRLHATLKEACESSDPKIDQLLGELHAAENGLAETQAALRQIHKVI